MAAQDGRTTIITGTGGLAYEAALALTAAGGKVILAGRSNAKGAGSVKRIKAAVPGAMISFQPLDLASLKSINNFAETVLASLDRLDILINNAGVMAIPDRRTTMDGFELQFGTNHLGHYALTGRLMPLLRRTSGSRVVSVSSLAHKGGKIDFDDLQAKRGYKPWPAYNQSKLANLMFALEFQRRSRSAGWGVSSMAAHPGLATTDLLANGPSPKDPLARITRIILPLLGQSAPLGALPILYAATDHAAQGGKYYGPRGFSEMKGAVTEAKIARQAGNEADCSRLWDVSSQLTGVNF